MPTRLVPIPTNMNGTRYWFRKVAAADSPRIGRTSVRLRRELSRTVVQAAGDHGQAGAARAGRGERCALAQSMVALHQPAQAYVKPDLRTEAERDGGHQPAITPD